MKEYQKMLRRLNSHPGSALKYLRRFTQRERSCCLKCGVRGRPHIHHTDTRGIITYYCPHCKQTYSELYGTVFYRSKVPLHKWCCAILEWLLSTGSISAAELGRRLDLKHETAWRLLMNIRSCIAENMGSTTLEKLVEGDEAWFGKKDNQSIVAGFVQRHARKLVLEEIPNVKEETLYPLVKQHVKRGSSFFTDARISYAATSVHYHHQTTNHSQGEFAREKGIHSNTIEQIWGDIKGIIRTIHHGISKKYRKLYFAQYILKYQYALSRNLFYTTFCQLLRPMFRGI